MSGSVVLLHLAGAVALMLFATRMVKTGVERAYGDVLRMSLPLALITMLVAPPWFGLLDRITGRFEHPHRSGLLGRK